MLQCDVLLCISIGMPAARGPESARGDIHRVQHTVLQCVAVCCSVLQCVAVCCSVLQCVAVVASLVMQVSREFHEEGVCCRVKYNVTCCSAI